MLDDLIARLRLPAALPSLSLGHLGI